MLDSITAGLRDSSQNLASAYLKASLGACCSLKGTLAVESSEFTMTSKDTGYSFRSERQKWKIM